MNERPDETHDHEEEPSVLSERIRRANEDRSRERRKTGKHRERAASFPSSAEVHEDWVAARIVRPEGAFFVARLEDGSELRVKTYKGTMTESPNATLVAVGDHVKISLGEGETGLVEVVAPRKTKLSRRASGRRDVFEHVVVSNVDTLVIVASVDEPPLRPGIIDRFIVAGLQGGLEIIVVINKIDLAHSAEYRDMIREFINVYASLGYPTVIISAKDGEGLEDLRAAIRGKTSVFAGHSGVGKSSLVNALLGSEVERTGVLQRKFKRGAHTTTGSVLRPIHGLPDTFVVDTPGVREFSNFELDSENLKFSFVEFLPLMEQCKITNCTHIHEPGCAVIEAVEQDAISAERYASYVKLYEEAREEERKQRYKE